MVQGKGLLVTEAPMTIPLISAQGCVPVLDEVFFEFEDESGKLICCKICELDRTTPLFFPKREGFTAIGLAIACALPITPSIPHAWNF